MWLVVQVIYYKIRRWRIFFLRVVSRKKEEKSSTDEITTRRALDLPLRFFCPTSRSIQESEDFFSRRATYKGEYGKAKEAVESARAGLSPQKGTWESQEKKETKEGEKVAPAKARFRVP